MSLKEVKDLNGSVIVANFQIVFCSDDYIYHLLKQWELPLNKSTAVESNPALYLLQCLDWSSRQMRFYFLNVSTKLQRTF